MQPAFIMAQYVDVIFKKDGEEVFRAQGSIGCIRQGEPHDSYTIIRGAMFSFNRAAKTNIVKDFDTVEVGKKIFTRAQLEKAGLVTPKKPEGPVDFCGTPPRPKK